MKQDFITRTKLTGLKRPNTKLARSVKFHATTAVYSFFRINIYMVFKVCEALQLYARGTFHYYIAIVITSNRMCLLYVLLFLFCFLFCFEHQKAHQKHILKLLIHIKLKSYFLIIWVFQSKTANCLNTFIHRLADTRCIHNQLYLDQQVSYFQYQSQVIGHNIFELFNNASAVHVPWPKMHISSKPFLAQSKAIHYPWNAVTPHKNQQKLLYETSFCLLYLPIL